MIPVNMGEDWRICTGVNHSFPPEKPNEWLTGTRESIRKTNGTGALVRINAIPPTPSTMNTVTVQNTVQLHSTTNSTTRPGRRVGLRLAADQPHTTPVAPLRKALGHRTAARDGPTRAARDHQTRYARY